MTKQYIICDPEKCVGCQICELACSARKEKSFNPQFSRIHAVRLNSIIEPIVNVALTCMLCEDPICVKVCAPNALSVDQNTGLVKVDVGYSGCNECGWCGITCEFGAPTLHPIKRVITLCDLCINDSEPACILACPKEALSLAAIDDVIEMVQSEPAKKILQNFSHARENSVSLFERIGRIAVILQSQRHDHSSRQ
jgi:Fe-S-cluster-containing dehydrogenase component